MVELRFARSLYHPAAVEEAVRSFDALATFDVKHQGAHVVVTVHQPHPAYGDRVADELANHALALSVRRHRAT